MNLIKELPESRLLFIAREKEESSFFHKWFLPLDVFKIVYKAKRNEELFERWKKEETFTPLFDIIRRYGKRSLFCYCREEMNAFLGNGHVSEFLRRTCWSMKRLSSQERFDIWKCWCNKENLLKGKATRILLYAPEEIRGNECVLGYFDNMDYRYDEDDRVDLFECLSEELKNDEDFLKRLAKIDWCMIRFMPLDIKNKILNDKGICLEICRKGGTHLMNEKMMNDFDICIASWGGSYTTADMRKFTPEERWIWRKKHLHMARQECLCKMPFTEKYSFMYHMCTCNTATQTDVIIEKEYDEIIYDPEVVVEMLSHLLEGNIQDKILNDKDYAMQIMSADGKILSNDIFSPLLNDKDIVAVALRNGFDDVDKIPKGMMPMKDIIENLCYFKGYCDFPSCKKHALYDGDLKFAIQAVSKRSLVAAFMSDRIKKEFEFVKAWVRSNPYFFSSDRNLYQNSEELKRTVIQIDYKHLLLLGHRIHEKLLHFAAFERFLQIKKCHLENE